MAIGTIPPWISVSPRDFLAAAEAGASTGLQVANLRQRGALESARLAQAAAEAAARRSSAEAQASQALGFRQWEREMMDRARTAALAQQGQQAGAALAERAREADMRNAVDLAKLEATEAAKRGTLDKPVRWQITKVGDKLFATDPYTRESQLIQHVPASRSATPTKSGIIFHGVKINPDNPDAGTMTGPAENTAILDRLGTNLPPSLRMQLRGPTVSDPLGILDK